MMKSRIKQSSKNLIANGIYYALKTVLALIVRTIFIYVFGMEYLGINSIVANILSVLSLAEMGIGGAIVYNMYKPMAEGDNDKINSLLAFYKKFYLIISAVIFVLGIAVIPILPIIIDYNTVAEINVTIIYLFFLLSTVISYFMAHRRALLLTSQNKYVESIINIVTYTIAFLLQLFVLFVLKNFYLYVGVTIVTNVLDSTFIYFVTNKMFPFISRNTKDLDVDTKKNISTNTKAILFHKVGGVVLNSTDSLVIQLVLGSLVVSAIYSNYWMIYTTITSIMVMLFDSIQGSIGNIIASGDTNQTRIVFNRLNFITSWVIGFCSISLFCLLNPFISFMWGNNYVWDITFSLVVALCFYINMSRQLAYYFKISAGLFKQDKYAPVIEAVINIIVSIILTYLLGAVGVVLGTIISCLCVPFWNIPRILYRNYFKTKFFEYWIQFLKYAIITIIIGFLTFLICKLIPDSNIWFLLLKFLTCFIMPNLLYCLIYCKNSNFIYFKSLVINLFNKVKNKIKNKNS